MKKIGIAYGFLRGNWIGRSTNELFELLKSKFGTSGFEVKKIGLLDTKVKIIRNSLEIVDATDGESLSELSGVYFANWRKQPEFALAAAELMKRQGKPILSQEVLQVMPMTKLGEMILLSDKDIPLPDSVFMRTKRWLSHFKNGGKLSFKPPFIAKVIDGSMGADNYLVESKKQFKEILKANPDRMFVVQRFIPNKHDFRVIIIGGEVKLIIKRARVNDDTHVNNTSQGASGVVVPINEVSEEFLNLAKRAAEAVKRPSFAGVDIIEDSETGKYYVLEVNKTPQMETGTNTELKVDALVSYFIKGGA